MRRIAAVAVGLIVGVTLAGCSGGATGGPSSPPTEASPTTAPPTTPPTFVETPTVPAPSLKGNLLGDPAERDVRVVLPPSYFDGDQRYPVVYFLEGYEEATGLLAAHVNDFGEQMQAEGKREFIVVEADGKNTLSGNFYANSPVGGNMADFVADDLTSYIDATYRTIPDRTARGLAGFSMGGSGTVNLGLSRPDVFSVIYAQSPGLLRPTDGLASMLSDNGSWGAYAAAFAPNPTATARPYAHLLEARTPLDQQDPSIVAAYESGYGNLEAKVAAYLAGTDKLAQIRLAYGTNDNYRWIPEGTAYFDQLLTANDVDHSLRVFTGSHQVDQAFFASNFVDYFSTYLAPQS